MYGSDGIKYQVGLQNINFFWWFNCVDIEKRVWYIKTIVEINKKLPD